MRLNISIASIFSLSLLVLSSCSKPQEKEREKIAVAEKALFADSLTLVADANKADSVIGLYTHYADQFPDDTLSPEYLFRAGDLANGIANYKDAIGYYGRVQRYPNYAKAASALFLQGFISENGLNDTANARRYYERFVAQYPKHKLANDVKISLQNLGKTPEELIEEFEARLTAGDSLNNP